MHVIVISASLIIRKGIVGILEGEESIQKITHSHLYTDIFKEKYDVILIDINNNKDCLYDIEDLKKNTSVKVIVLDFYEDGNLFSKCMKIGVDGYILANVDCEDINYAVKQVAKGKRYFDPVLIENYMTHDGTEFIETLTKREKEILTCISKGKSNQEISKELFITEHTVKKHISNILAKLNLKDRTQAALYAKERGIARL